MKKPQPKPKPKPRKKTPQTHQVRIIGGRWKRTSLAVADAPDLRPTPDRVRETVFNWLNHLLDGAWDNARCLDLFAGSGALGFEAASRGAARVTMVESHTPVFLQLEEVKSKLNAEQVNLIRGDADRVARSLAQRGERFDIIFLDPPYQQNLLEKMLLVCAPLLEHGGMVYAESDVPLVSDKRMEAPLWMAPWEAIRSDRAGNVHYHLLQLKNTDHLKA